VATTITTTTLYDGSKRRVIHVAINADGSPGQLTDEVLYDYSADTTKPDDADGTNLAITHLCCNNASGGTITIKFDGTTDGIAVAIPSGMIQDIDYTRFAGIKNTATAPTGDITLSTRSFGSNGVATLILCVDKT
jgi:hypothetical protein